MSTNSFRIIIMGLLAFATPCLVSACADGPNDGPVTAAQPEKAEAPAAPAKATPEAKATPKAPIEGQTSDDNIEASWKTFTGEAIEAYGLDEDTAYTARAILSTCLDRAKLIRQRLKGTRNAQEHKAVMRDLYKLNDQVVGRIVGLASIEQVQKATKKGFKAPKKLLVEVRPDVGHFAPNITVTRPDGTKVSLKEMRGKTVVLHFWASWCGFCKRALPEIKKLHDAVGDNPNVAIWGINCRQKPTSPDPVKYFADNSFTWDLFLNGDESATAYGVKGYPTMFVVGPDGMIIHKERGAKAGPATRLIPLIEKHSPKDKAKTPKK